jgi:Skp family chaperone for outer membrane proteins
MPIAQTTTGPLDPFTTAGAAHISQIAGQQVAPTSANVLSAPTLPSIPQPVVPPPPAAPVIPSLDSIFNTPDTPLDTEFKTATTNEAGLAGQLAGQTAYQTAQETANDITGKKATVTDLTTQLNNLKAAGDQIPLQFQNDAQGRGETVAGLGSLQSSAVRNNTIQQLGVSAMLNAANGNLASAQDQVTAAVKAKFDPIQAQLDAQKAQLEAITPLLDAEEKKQAAAQAAQLQERQTAITQQQDDQKTIYQTMLAAAQNGADSVTLQNIHNATTPDAAIAAAGNSLVKPNTQVVNANGRVLLVDQTTGKTIADLGTSDAALKLASANSPSANVTLTDSSGKSLNVPVDVAPYVSTSHSGVAYADLSTVQGTAAEKKSIIDQAQAAGLKVITNKNTALDLTNIGDANAKLDTISTIMAGIDQPDALSRGLYGIGLTKLATLAQSNPQQAAAGALQGVGLDILKAISGVQGFRGNASVVQQITDHLPSIYDTNDVVQTKTDYIRQLISDRENAILGQAGTNAPAAQAQTYTLNGKTYVQGADGLYYPQ